MEELLLAWAAGFLEGEGTFHRWKSKGRSYARVKASQVNRAPLVRLMEIFGGSIHRDRRPTPGRQEIWYWSIFGKSAEDVMQRILPLMSETRAEQIRIALQR